jgi:uncharacterized protein YndB with AHSA1/START domain
MQRRTLLGSLALATPALHAATAQDRWPSREISLVTGFGPGGGTDVVAREAGVSQPYVVRMFGTKRELFLAAFALATDQIHDAFRAVLDAPREAVWRAYTDHLAEWWCPRPWTAEVVANELRAGGRSLIMMRGPAGEEQAMEGLNLEVVPAERVVFTNALAAGWIPQAPFPLIVGSFEFADPADFGESGFANFADLLAGQSSGPLTLSFATATVGAFLDTITLHGVGHNASGYSGAIGDIQLVVRGIVDSQAQPPTGNVPEPDSLLLLGLGIPLLFLRRGRGARARR